MLKDKFRSVGKSQEDYEDIVKAMDLIRETLSINGVTPTKGLAAMIGMITVIMHDSKFSYEEYKKTMMELAKHYKYFWEDENANADK